MLRIIIIFMLLASTGSPMNTLSPDNTSINKSLFNNSSLNDTQKSELGIDMSLFKWFSKPTKPDIAQNLRLALEEIKRDFLKDAIESYSAEKSITEEDFSRRSIPPEINKKLESYPRQNTDDKDTSIDSEPPFDPGEEWDPWLQKPPWKEDIKRGCSEPVCDENGICYVECSD